jgi:hypothetical protein
MDIIEDLFNYDTLFSFLKNYLRLNDDDELLPSMIKSGFYFVEQYTGLNLTRKRIREKDGTIVVVGHISANTIPFDLLGAVWMVIGLMYNDRLGETSIEVSILKNILDRYRKRRV